MYMEVMSILYSQISEISPTSLYNHKITNQISEQSNKLIADFKSMT